MTVFKSEINIFCLFRLLRVSSVRNWLPFICSTWNVWNHCDCWGEALLFYKSVYFGKSRQISQENSVNCVSMPSGGDGGKWTPFSMKLISKSLAAVVWWSRGRCNVRNCSLSWYWLDFIFAFWQPYLTWTFNNFKIRFFFFFKMKSI